MRIGVSSYSFQQYINDGRMTQLDVPAKAKEMGFDAVEFIDLCRVNGQKMSHEDMMAYAREIRAEAERVGIEIVAYTIGASLYQETDEKSAAEVERLCRMVDVAEALGAKVMRHDACWTLTKTGSGRSFDLMLPTIAKNAQIVTGYAKERGIKTCVENHGFIAQDSDRMERLYNAVNDENFGLLVDMGNFLCVDEDPTLAVSRVSPYAVHVHVKDFMRTDNGGILTRACNHIVGCTAGDGVVPVGKCLAILKRAGYDGVVSLEYEGSEDAVSSIAKGKAFLDSVLANI